MATLPSIRSASAEAFGSTTYRPVALFVGGTSGCGEGTASAFARATNGNAHIMICGRNKASAERIIASLPQTPQSRYEFIECDASLMANVVKAAADVKALVGGTGTLNYLVLSQGILNLNGFEATSEGMDRKMAVCFYSRWKFVDELLPCLERAATLGQEARVMSILNPHLAEPLNLDDLGLKKHYSLKRFREGGTYHNIMVHEYAKCHPSISFIHSYPGHVKTTIGNGLPWYIRMLLAIPTMLKGESIEVCGEHMTALLVSPTFKNGDFCLDERGGKIDAQKVQTEEKVRDALMVHYTQEMAPYK